MIFKDVHGCSKFLQDIVKFIERKVEYKIYIGTDSQVHRKTRCIMYATCIVLYRVGKGGRIFIHKEKCRLTKSLKQRLMNETWRSLMVAFDLKKLSPKDIEITIHIDVNKNKKWKSALYMEELVGSVVGQGFKVNIKPDAWAAQSVADKFAR